VDGRPGTPPALLVGCIARDGESSRSAAAEAVRTRLDWKYPLGLSLADPGFDFSALSEFRGRLAVDERVNTLLSG
jgi:transposase